MEYIIYMMVCILQPTCWPLPEMTTVIYGVARFGGNITFLMAYMGIITGIFIMYNSSFSLSEKFLSEFKKREKYLKFKKCVEKNEILATGLLFIIPIIPDEVICIGAGILGINKKVFFTIAIFAKMISIGMIAFLEPLQELLAYFG